MLDFARSIFGMGTHFKVVSTIHHRNSIPKSLTNSVLHNYTMVNIKDLSATSMVACHTMPYPYTVFYCHHTETQTKVFKVSVISEDADEKVDAVVVCHMDTSEWNPAHVSFRVLKIKPGTDPVCHFFPEDHLVWVLPASAV
ncbi:Burp domain-containing protein bnm2c [Thalictrum thalictroides]|uniref:Burp domain-containing protein bnm2c n=1 Tax=Thalictrum thalictroides TaxID=46969 RepID=A0A7J6VJY2_THATH|nr:Burp domain-containing protein bnm2c [Thalictrum thalictroides]